MMKILPSFIAILVALGIVGITSASPARAEIISLRCTGTGQTIIVNIDLATSLVTNGYVEDQGTRYGPWTAQISAQIIAWNEGPVWRKTLSRVTGDLHTRGRAGSDWHESCTKVDPPKSKI
jgi:hypothetical protein